MLFDFDKVPFSRHQRFTTLSMMGEGADRALYLRYVAGGDERRSLGRLCRIRFEDEAGLELSPKYDLTPAALEISLFDGAEQVGTAAFAVGEGETLHFEAEKVAVVFALEGSRYDYAYRTAHGADCVVAAGENLRLTPFAHQGQIKVSGQWRRDHADNVEIRFAGAAIDAGLLLHERLAPDLPSTDFDQVRTESAAAFNKWRLALKGEAPRLASYLLWANCVPKTGQLTAPAIYMSKNHMINIWSWDNAFSAIGVADNDPQLAFDQFAAIFDHQDQSGMLPDFVHDQGASFSFTKPPVHGWAIGLMRQRNPEIFTPAQLDYLRQKLVRQYRYWMIHTRADENALPSYAHGNDSGWDNASFFAEGGPVIGPDLPTFLALTARTIAQLAERAGDGAQAQEYKQQEAQLISLLMDQLWDGTTFQVRLVHDTEKQLPDQSLIQFMPLLLGDKLPHQVTAKLLQRLDKLGMVTAWGLATESPRSSFYEADGYWRGPIWAPTTLLIVEGLLAQNERERAREIMQKYQHLCATSGMAENFDALSGAGLRDKAFAWTSAVYLRFAQLLANDFGEEN
ncbi:amylo-alpha-1,6-glucosidase [Maritalea mediterranea]|uniref:Glycoside hydrolase family 37 n=1 Tax=Maritalea mediterranea TaxID=2909667 RepID=A0ABS9E3B6_9HYPH|nr:trehalase family glycosidase [Maritalea mediterranea]MCF4097273.1 glycoside hydrolase family 37 [Maritalea mediterranea]